MYQAEIHLRQDKECALSRAAAAAGETFEVHIEELHDHKVTFIVEAGEHVDTCYEVMAAAEEVEYVERLDDENVLVTKPSCGAYRAVAANHGILRRRNTISKRRRQYTVMFFEREDLKEIVGGFREIGTVSLEALTPLQHSGTLLTERQREVVEQALAAGYFEWPREVTSEELAAEIGISRATFLEHLRKAERKLLSQLVDDGGSTAGLAAGAGRQHRLEEPTL